MDSEAAFLARHAQSFGAVAPLYDQARPGYPAELFEHLAGQLTGPRVLEVGAGTGKATVGLTALGVEVTCVEPDAQMADVLAQRTAARPPARIVVTSFESFATEEKFDALVSAQAWHWTDPATRMERAAALLQPGGFVGLIWNSAVIPADAFAAIGAIYDEFALFGRDRPGDPLGSAADLAALQDPDGWPGNEIAGHPGFEYLGTQLFPWEQNLTAAQFSAFLESTSFYQVLDPEIRRRLLGSITSTIRQQFGDLISMSWSAQCYEARGKQPPGVSRS